MQKKGNLDEKNSYCLRVELTYFPGRDFRVCRFIDVVRQVRIPGPHQDTIKGHKNLTPNKNLNFFNTLFTTQLIKI